MMTYDQKCYDLASHFLSDEKGATVIDIQNLAQAIQSAIEDWLEDWEGKSENSVP
jgi:hypothetical protein